MVACVLLQLSRHGGVGHLVAKVGDVIHAFGLNFIVFFLLGHGGNHHVGQREVIVVKWLDEAEDIIDRIAVEQHRRDAIFLVDKK